MGKSNPVQKAVRIVGSEAKLADLIGVSQPAINKAKRAGRCSAEMAVKIDHALSPRITKTDLRPDLWPAVASPSELEGAH